METQPARARALAAARGCRPCVADQSGPGVRGSDGRGVALL